MKRNIESIGIDAIDQLNETAIVTIIATVNRTIVPKTGTRMDIDISDRDTLKTTSTIANAIITETTM